MKRYKVASLFSGCGGMDIGIEGDFDYLGKRYRRLNAEVVFSTDFDDRIVGVYNANFELKSEVKNIIDLSSEEIPDHDILTGGFPCQSFSVVAQNPKRLGYDDHKGKLFFEMCRILREKKPKAFIAENVKGILSANNREAFPLILEEFKNCGYHVAYKVLNASDYGVPQKRERVFIVGFRDAKAMEVFDFPQPTTLDSPTPLSAVLIPEAEVPADFYFSKKAIEGMKASKNSKLMNKGRAQNPDVPCNTVGAHLAKVSLNSTDPVLCLERGYRMFTPREVARIQSFPESYILEGSKTLLYKALGNAVAPVMMWHLSNQVIDALDRGHSNGDGWPAKVSATTSNRNKRIKKEKQGSLFS